MSTYYIRFLFCIRHLRYSPLLFSILWRIRASYAHCLPIHHTHPVFKSKGSDCIAQKWLSIGLFFYLPYPPPQLCSSCSLSLATVLYSALYWKIQYVSKYQNIYTCTNVKCIVLYVIIRKYKHTKTPALLFIMAKCAVGINIVSIRVRTCLLEWGGGHCAKHFELTSPSFIWNCNLYMFVGQLKWNKVRQRFHIVRA